MSKVLVQLDDDMGEYSRQIGEDLGERYPGSPHRNILFDNGKTIGCRPDTFNYLLPHSAAPEKTT